MRQLTYIAAIPPESFLFKLMYKDKRSGNVQSNRFMRNLRSHPAAFQFSALMGIYVIFFILSSFVALAIASGLPPLTSLDPANASSDIIKKYKLLQFASAVLIFIGPSVVFYYLMRTDIARELGLRSQLNGLFMGVVVLLLLSSAPVVSVLGEWNQNLFWGSLQESVNELEKNNTKVMTVMLRMDGPADLVINLLLMAVLPAISEELFFRGALQRSLHRWWNKPVLAVIGSSIFFAILHGSVAKLVPIFVMGAILGLLFMITNNLWYSIVLHFLFNGIQIVMLYFSQKKQIPGFDAEKQEFYFPLWAGLTGLVVIILLFLYLNRENKTWRSI